MSFWGLTQQDGPWKNTAQDVKNLRESKTKVNGGGIGVGGTLHAGHGDYESSTSIYQQNGRLPPPKMSKYASRSVMMNEKIFYPKPRPGVSQQVTVVAGGRPEVVSKMSTRTQQTVEPSASLVDEVPVGGHIEPYPEKEMLYNNFASANEPHITMDHSSYGSTLDEEEQEMYERLMEQVEPIRNSIRNQSNNDGGLNNILHFSTEYGIVNGREAMNIPRTEDYQDEEMEFRGIKTARRRIPQEVVKRPPFVFTPPRMQMQIDPSDQKYVESKITPKKEIEIEIPRVVRKGPKMENPKKKISKANLKELGTLDPVLAIKESRKATREFFKTKRNKRSAEDEEGPKKRQKTEVSKKTKKEAGLSKKMQKEIESFGSKVEFKKSEKPVSKTAKLSKREEAKRAVDRLQKQHEKKPSARNSTLLARAKRVLNNLK